MEVGLIIKLEGPKFQVRFRPREAFQSFFTSPTIIVIVREGWLSCSEFWEDYVRRHQSNAESFALKKRMIELKQFNPTKSHKGASGTGNSYNPQRKSAILGEHCSVNPVIFSFFLIKLFSAKGLFIRCPTVVENTSLKLLRMFTVLLAQRKFTAFDRTRDKSDRQTNREDN